MSSAGDTQQSSRVQGARVSSALLCPMESVGPGAKTACVALWIRGALGLWFAAGGVFPFAECSSQKLVLGLRCNGASALSGRAGSRGMAGAGRRRLSRAQSCFPTKENPWGVGFGRRDPQQSSRAQGARGSPAPLCPMERVGRGRKRLALLSGSDARWGCSLLLEECFPLQNAAARSSFGAEGATGPQRCAAELAQGAWLGTVRMRPSSP